MTPATNKRYPQYKDFESFLMEKFSDSVNCTEDDPGEDGFPDAFDAWVQEVDVDVMLAYADLYASIRVVEEVNRAGDRLLKGMGEVGGV